MRTIQIGKTIQVVEKRLDKEAVFDFIDRLEHDDIVLAPCPCRTGTESNKNRECHDRNPVGTCIFLGISAVHIEEKELGKKVTKKIALDYVDAMISLGLYATVDNELTKDSVICLCCGCCCSHLGLGFSRNDLKSPFSKMLIPKVYDNCIFCGECVKVCFFKAIVIDEEKKKLQISEEKCSGCGFCVFACPNKALELVNKK